MAKHLCCCSKGLLTRRVPESLTYQFVRWRKPIWVPKAKSKIYRVPERREPNTEEQALSLKWTHDYNNTMKSIRSYIQHFMVEQKARSIQAQMSYEDIEAEVWANVKERNEKWNSEVETLRTADLERIQQKLAKRDEAVIERDKREKEEQMEEAEQRVKQELEAAESFIKEEDLETKVEELLNTRADYDFALNLDGSTTKTDKTPYGT